MCVRAFWPKIRDPGAFKWCLKKFLKNRQLWHFFSTNQKKREKMDRIELAKKIYSESNTKMSQVAHSFWNEYLELLHFAGNKLNTLQEGCEIIKLTMKMMLKCEENEPKNILLTIRCALRAVEEAIAEVECSDSET